MEQRKGWRARARGWIADAAARALADRDASAAVGEALETAQKARQLLEDIETAVWHLVGLPSRRDVRQLIRKATSIAHRIETLEENVRAIEEATEEPRDARAPTSSARERL